MVYVNYFFFLLICSNLIFLFDFKANGNVHGINDASNFKAIQKAMSVIEMSSEEQKEIFQIVGSVLHMGNVGFSEDEVGQATILKPESVGAIAKVYLLFF